jgi:O-antigen/teichoic acid export membrane protein
MSRDAFWNALSRVLSVVLMLAATVVVARQLGPEGQGQYAVIVTFAATVVQFGTLGLHSSNTYQLAQSRELLKALAANSLWISLLFGGLVAALSVACCRLANWPSGESDAILWLGGAMIPSRLYFVLAGSILLGLGQFGWFNTLQVLNYASILVATLVCSQFEAGPAQYVTATMLASTAIGLLSFAALWRQGARSLAFDLQTLGAGTRYAAKVHVVCFLGFLILRGNVFLIETFHGAAEAGLYSTAGQVGDVLSLLPASFAMILFPKLVDDSAHRWQKTVSAMRAVALYMLLACTGCMALTSIGLRLAFGTAYLPAAPIVLSLLPASCFLSLTSVLSQYLAAVGFPRALIGVWTVGLLAMIACGLLFIPQWGGVGAGISQSITYAAVFLLELYVVRLTWPKCETQDDSIPLARAA